MSTTKVYDANETDEKSNLIQSKPTTSGNNSSELASDQQTNTLEIRSEKIKINDWKKTKCICVESNIDCETVISFMNDKRKWGINNPELILSVTGGATNIALRHEVKKIFKEGLIKAAKSTGAWIISGGTDYGVMKLVGDAVNEGIKTENLVVLGIATKCKFTTSQDNEALLINNGEKKLNPYHSHFIFVSDGESTEWGQEIAFRSELEEKLIGHYGHMVLIVVGGGKGTFKTVYETLRKGYPVLLLEKSGGCADVLIKLCSDKQNSNSVLSEQDILNALNEIKLTDEERQQSLIECLNIIEKVKTNPDLINVFGMNNDEDIEYATLKALRNKNRNTKENNRQNADHLKHIQLAFKWNAVDYFTKTLTEYECGMSDELKELFHKAIIKNKPMFVEIMLDRFDVENFINQGDLETIYEEIYKNYKKLPFVFLMGDYKKDAIEGSETAAIKKKVSQIFQNLMRNSFDFTDTLLKVTHNSSVDLMKNSYVYQNLFILSILFNRFEIAFIFWKRGNNQIINALFASQFLIKLVNKCGDDDQEVLKYSKKFEDAAIGTMKTIDSHTHYFMNYYTLFRHVDYYKTSPLEMAVVCDRKKFVAQATVQKILDDIWFGMVDEHRLSFFDCKFLKYMISICSYGLFAPLFYQRDRVFRKSEGKMSDREENFFPLKICKNVYFKETFTNINNEVKQNINDKRNIDNQSQSNKKENRASSKKVINCCIEYFLTVKDFLSTPVVQSSYAMIYFVLFLLVFSHFLISDFPLKKDDIANSSIQIIEFFLLNLIVFSLFVEELDQLLNPIFQRKDLKRSYCSNFKKCLNIVQLYYKDEWNFLDTFGIIVFIMADIMCIVSLFISNHIHLFYILHISKAIFSLDFVIWGFKALHFCALDQDLGPKLKILEKIIVKDMKFFIIVIGIISFLFGIVSHAALIDYKFEEYCNQTENSTAFSRLFNKPFTNTSNETEPFNIIEYVNYFEDALQDIIHNSYWPIFGEIKVYDKLECTKESCPKTYWHKFVFILLMFYVITILVLINLLIAMFNSTFEKLHEKTDIIWKFQRFYLISSYYKYSSAPPPFNLIHRIIKLIIRNKCEITVGGNGGDEISYIQLERQCAYEALNKLEMKKDINEDVEEEDEDI